MAKKKTARKATARKTDRKAAKKKTARKTVKQKAKKAVRKAVKKTVRKAAKKKTTKKVTRKKVAKKKTAKNKTVARKTAKKKTARKTTKKKVVRKSAKKKVVRKAARKTVKKAARKVAKKSIRKVTRKTTRSVTRKTTPPPAPEVTPDIIEPAAIEYTPAPAPVIDTEETNGPPDVISSPQDDSYSEETGPAYDHDHSQPDVAASASPPSTGSPAPGFELRDANGAFHTLSQYAGRRVVLFFYPKDDTPGCTSEVCGFRDVYGDFDTQDAVLLGVSPDSCESHYQFATKFNLPYPLLSDPEHRTAEAYGAWGEKTRDGETYMGVNRTTVIIDQNGQVANIFENVNPDGHNHEVVSWLRENLAAQPNEPYAPY